MKQGIILAAGLGSRLPEITKTIPKSLIRINGIPILERNIEFMFQAGLERVILVVGYKKEQFNYLGEKYSDSLIIIENINYAISNTISSMNCASKYFDYDSFVTTADIYLKINPFEKYYSDYSFYLLRPYSVLKKPDWIAKLDKNKRFISVDKKACEGFSYTGISFWKKKDLEYIKYKLLLTDWMDEKQRKQYWDELLLDDFVGFKLYAQILESDDEVYEFDDMGDIEILQKKDDVSIEW